MLDWTSDIQLFTALAASTSQGGMDPASSVNVETGPVNQVFIVKLVVVSIIMWFLKWLFSLGVGRAQLIHHLYSDIEARVNNYVRLLKSIRLWRTEYFDYEAQQAKPGKHRFGYIKEDPYIVYSSAMDKILIYLWRNEISKIHNVYRDFLEIEEKLDGVRQIVEQQGYDLSKLDDDGREWIIAWLDDVQGKAEGWDRLDTGPGQTVGRVVARSVFWRPTVIYLGMLLVGLIATLVGIPLIIDIAQTL